MNIYTVSLFGHRNMMNPLLVEEQLENEVYRLLKSQKYVNFLIDRTGEFDFMAALAIHRVMKTYSRRNSSLILVLPYQNKSYASNKEILLKLYDEIEVCRESSNAYYKLAFQLRNQNMIDRSELVLCCIEHHSGGAYQTVRYAEKQGKPIINLAENRKISD
ncbi:MAG: hypothetical protein K2G25_07465 [Oscillospiraceae bacterium]|nr:hypothetical protein [Oscillospiraceae bacterium]